MSGAGLPRWLSAFVTASLPSRTSPVVLGDLAEDLARRQPDLGPAGARRWVIREAMSIVAAYHAGRASAWLSPMAVARALAQPRGAWRDFKQANRALWRNPGFAALASLTLGAGLATLIITLGFIETLVLRPLSPVQPETLRRIVSVDRTGRQALRVSNVERAHIQDQLAGTAMLGAASLQPVLVRFEETSFQTLAEVVSADYFDVLGASALHGRLLFRRDDVAGAAPVAVVSDSLWRRFGRRPDLSGASLRVNGSPYTIVGVAHPVGTSSSFGASVDVWLPMAASDPIMNPGWRTRVDERWMILLTRLASSGDRPAADAALARARDHLARTIPDPWRERTLRTAPPTALVGSQRAMAVRLATLLAGLALLAVAAVCANLGALFFVRGAAARRAAAIRLSLGAARGTVLRQVLWEGVLVGLAASVLALALYGVARRALADVTILPTLSLRIGLPFGIEVVFVAAAAGLCAGVSLAIAPAWWLSRVQVARALRDQSGALTGGAGQARVRRLLLAAQLAVALVLAVQAGVLARTLDRLAAADHGIASDRLLAMDFDVEPDASIGARSSADLAAEALARVRRMPGIAAAAMANRAPVDSSTPVVEVVASADRGELRVTDVTFYLATPGYFETVGVGIVLGRDFTDTDVEQDVVVVNETLAERLWPRANPLDRALRLEPEGRSLRVIGIARNSRYRSLSEPPQPHLYRPTAPRFGLALLVRSVEPPAPSAAAVQRVLDAVGPGVQGFFPRTHSDHLAFDLLPVRAAAVAALIVGLVAAVLCLIGVYGLVSWLVQMRRAEIGVRMALGAAPRDIVGLIVGQGLRATAPGLIAGIVLAAAAARLTRGSVFGTMAADPTAYLGALLALTLVVILASWAPARRAAAIDPSVSLRRA
jgi:predicted permease